MGAGVGEGKYPTDQAPAPGPDRPGLDIQTSRHRAVELDRWGAEPDQGLTSSAASRLVSAWGHKLGGLHALTTSHSSELTFRNRCGRELLK